MNNRTLPLILVVLVLVLAGAAAYWHSHQTVATPTDTATTTPTGQTSTTTPAQPTQSDTAKLGERIFDNDVYITPVTLESDSRCPVDVQCIQAGEVVITAKLEDGTHSEVVTMHQGSPISFGNKHVTLMSATPTKNSKVSVLPSDYRFTFSVAYGMGGDAPQ